MAKDYYQTLGVPRSATEDEIKKAYRSLARKFHPDLHKGNKDMEARFKEINEAYSVLGDPKKRSEYDLTGRTFETGVGGGYQPPPPGGFNFEDFGFGLGGFDDIFGEIFGGRKKRKGPQKGTDLEYAIDLDFLQAVRGTEIKINVRRQSGTEKITVKIPAGIKTGSRVRVAGKGEEGEMGGQKGDLYISTTVRPHLYFRRLENDIYLDVPITIAEAALGADIKVPTIDGESVVKILPGTQSGQKLRLKGKGVFTPAGRGDQYLVISVAVPKYLDPKARDLIREVERLNPYEPRRGLW